METDPTSDLRSRVREQIARAQASGDLQPTQTLDFELEEDGVRFVVHRIAGRDRKKRSRREQARTGVDPFLPPYLDDLLVAKLSATHVALLNKFPVLDEHLLIVTREDEPQQSWLTREDFDALHACMQELDGLAFYNSGRKAGASQSHKHLQLVPMPVTTLSLLDSEARGFACALGKPDGAGGGALLACYRGLMQQVDLDGDRDAYNLLVTRERMAVIPRSRHDCQGIFLNAMAYAGSYLVRDAAQLERLREIGPRRALAEAGRPS